MDIATTFYFSPLPVLHVTGNDVVADCNVSAVALFGDKCFDLNGRGLHEVDFLLPLASGSLQFAYGAFCRDLSIATTIGELPFSLTVVRLSAESEEIGERGDYFVYFLPLGEQASTAHSVCTTAVSRELVWFAYAQCHDPLLLKLPFYLAAVGRHVQALEDSGARRVLDIGCGTGNVAIEMLQRGVSVCGIDTSLGMLAAFRKKVGIIEVPLLQAIHRSAEDLSHFPDGCFEAVTAMLSLYAMKQPRKALQECHRVLCTGGTLVLTEPVTGCNLNVLMDEAKRHFMSIGLWDWAEGYWTRMQHIKEYLDGCVASGKNESRTWSAEDACIELERLGCSIKSIVDSHHGTCSTIVAVR